MSSTLLSRHAPLVVLLGTAACVSSSPKSLEVVSRTNITGTINDSAVEGTVFATIDTGAGGSSSCTFPKLPIEFNPATIGTHW